MLIKSTLTLLVVLCFLAGQAQLKENYFSLTITNNSSFTTTCTILGNDKTDSIPAKESKTIVFDLDKDEISFYLNLWTTDLTTGSYRNKLIRILDAQTPRYITIDSDNRLKYSLTGKKVTNSPC